MTLVLGYDVETTGLEAGKDRIIEVGAVLWDVERKRPVDMMMKLVNHNIEIPELITELTGITKEDIDREGLPWQTVQEQLYDFIQPADYWVAHNAEFDKEMTLQHPELELSIAASAETLPWIDTKVDLPYPTHKGKGSLVTIAANHGFLNPFPHRAVFDVLTMMKIFGEYDWADIMARHESPSAELIAQVSYDERDKAKEAGFYWDAARKLWVRNIKECDARKEVPTWDFKVKANI